MYVQYTGVCAVQRGMFSTQGEYHEYSGGIMSTLGGVQYTGGYHDVGEGHPEGHWENNRICMETPLY